MASQDVLIIARRRDPTGLRFGSPTRRVRAHYMTEAFVPTTLEREGTTVRSKTEPLRVRIFTHPAKSLSVTSGFAVPEIGSKGEARRPLLPRASVLRVPVHPNNERKLRAHLTTG